MFANLVAVAPNPLAIMAIGVFSGAAVTSIVFTLDNIVSAVTITIPNEACVTTD